MKKLTLLTFLLLSFSAMAQDKNLPYHEIPDYSENYTAGSMAARMIDGLGFRFYWATEGLRKEDLSFKPSPEAKTSLETIDHIFSLSQVIMNAALHQVNEKNVNKREMSWQEKRERTLFNLKTASDALMSATDLNGFTVDFGTSQFPFWNAVNGPIADAIWHSGQIASFRRSSGNPINPQINHFTGKLRASSKQ